jgi:hypothetical protein
MNGQWFGRYEGSNFGALVIDLDYFDGHYEGTACAFDDVRSSPDTFVSIKTTDDATSIRGHFQLQPIHPYTFQPTTWVEVKKLYSSEISFPEFADIELDLHEDILKVSWKTNVGTFGSSSIERTKANAPSAYSPLPNVNTWQDFKQYVHELEYRRYIFRGQARQQRLRTTFHRSGRASLARFLNNDIKTLHRHLSLRTKHVFNLGIPEENGAFFNLVQHHGYPTPLLDWTYSPFVAAFFACHRIRNSDARKAKKEEKIRIFVFDQKAWIENYRQSVNLAWTLPHFSLMEFIAIDNERLTPQQSISSVTNVDDIESHIRSTEKEEGQFLKIIDLPKSERPEIMKELSVMGITAGSLFPGLDGACEELKERFFDL